MVHEEEDQVERYIGSLPDNIQSNVIVAEPTRLQDAFWIANNLMDQKLKGYAVKNAKNKRRLEVNQRDNRPCTVRRGKCNKIGHLTRDCKVTNSTTSTQRGQVVNQRVVTCFECGRQRHYMSDCPKLKDQNRGNKAGNKNEIGKARGKAYVLHGGPLYNKCKFHHEGPCTVRYWKCNKVGHLTKDCKEMISTTSTQRGQVVNQRVLTCFECGRQGHYRSDYQKLKDLNCGNETGNKSNIGKERGKAYVLGGGDANPDSNTVTSTFLLNNHYVYVLFDSGADRSFASNTFSALLDVIPSTLDVSYAVKLIDERIAETDTVLRGCTLGLLGYQFNIDLMPVDLGSFDAIIDMNWMPTATRTQMSQDAINELIAKCVDKALKANCPEKYQVKYATCTLLNSALTWWNSHKRTIGTDSTFAMSWREFMKLMTEELTMMCTKMVLEEEDRVGKFIEGLPDNIQGNVITTEPTRLQDAIRIANNLMDQKLKGYTVRKQRTREGWRSTRETIMGNNHHSKDRMLEKEEKHMSLEEETLTCKAIISTTSTQRGQVVNQRVLTYFECGRQGHYRSDFSKLKDQNHRNKTRNKSGISKAKGKAYVLCGGDASPDSNVVTGYDESEMLRKRRDYPQLGVATHCVCSHGGCSVFGRLPT
nr:hypothetical protein [Tanacetum cinerariifolium]